MLEKTSESPFDSKETKPVNLKGNQPWLLIGRNDAETPVFWSSDVNSQLIGKVPDAGKNWGQRRRGCQKIRWLGGITDAKDMNLDKLREMVRDRGVWPAAVHGVPTSQTQLSQQSMYVYIHILIYTHTCIIQKNQEKEREKILSFVFFIAINLNNIMLYNQGLCFQGKGPRIRDICILRWYRKWNKNLTNT